MPMPHRTFAQVAKRRLTGKEGRERIREVRALLAELPDYRNGPYADLRKWLLSEIQIKTGDYPFTTLRPVPALTRIGGVLVQLVEIPGLIGGASEDRGGGRALLGVLRSADTIVYCMRANGDPAELR